MDYRYGSHTVYKIEYHFVWVTKYRYHMLRGDVGERDCLKTNSLDLYDGGSGFQPVFGRSRRLEAGATENFS